MYEMQKNLGTCRLIMYEMHRNEEMCKGDFTISSHREEPYEFWWWPCFWLLRVWRVRHIRKIVQKHLLRLSCSDKDLLDRMLDRMPVPHQKGPRKLVKLNDSSHKRLEGSFL